MPKKKAEIGAAESETAEVQKGIEPVVMHVRLTFSESILGTSPNNENVYRDFIATKAPDAKRVEEEIANLGIDEVAEKTMTIFPKLADGTPFIYSYQVKGFFKDTCSGLRLVPGSKSSGLKSHKKVIDKLIMVDSLFSTHEGYQTESERSIIPIVSDYEITELQRPLRTSGPSGERTALSMSEEVAPTSTAEFLIRAYNKAYAGIIREWLDYGRDSGIGQWRNSGHGRFLWEELDDEGNVIGGNYNKYHLA